MARKRKGRILGTEPVDCPESETRKSPISEDFALQPRAQATSGYITRLNSGGNRVSLSAFPYRNSLAASFAFSACCRPVLETGKPDLRKLSFFEAMVDPNIVMV